MTASKPADEAATLRGIAFMLAAGLLFVLKDACAKHLTQTYPVIQVVWARYVFHMLTLPILVGRRDWPAVLATRRLGLQLVRSLLLIGSTYFFFLAVRHIPLATATAIGFVSPLLLTALAVPLLGEQVGLRRSAAVMLGFLGTLVIIRPGTGMLHWAALLPLLVAVCFALYQIATRVLARTDSWRTTLFYSAAPAAVATTLLVPFEWQSPDLAGWAIMALLGLLGSLAHLAMIRAFAAAPASALAPLTYVQLVWSALVGFLAFGDLPDRWTLIGAGVVAGSGLYVLYREHALRGRTAGRPAAPGARKGEPISSDRDML